VQSVRQLNLAARGPVSLLIREMKSAPDEAMYTSRSPIQLAFVVREDGSLISSRVRFDASVITRNMAAYPTACTLVRKG
jgi:hypothetical protein